MDTPADNLPASLAFLTDAAHLLSSASPQTAAHLMTQRNALMAATGLVVSDVQRQHACTACGHIMVPGHGDTLKLETRRALRTKHNRSRIPRQKQKSSPPPASQSSGSVRKRLECSLCSSYTDIKIAPAPPITRRRPAAVSSIKNNKTPMTAAHTQASAAVPAVPAAAAAAPIPLPEQANKSSVNASSKKRAKSRKQGLQALLQQSRSSAPQSGGLGLSLSDFLKK